MPLPFLATLGASALGAGASLLGANAAAKAQRRATEASLKLQKEQYDQTRADQLPYMTAGYGAVEDLQGDLQAGPTWAYGPEDYRQSPGFNYLLDQTLAQVQARAAAGGFRLSDATLARLAQSTGGLLSQDYYQQQGISRANYESDRNWRTTGLTNLAGWGQNAAGQAGMAGQNYASGANNALMSRGAAQGAAAMNKAGVVNSLLSQAADAYGAYKSRLPAVPTPTIWSSPTPLYAPGYVGV